MKGILKETETGEDSPFYTAVSYGVEKGALAFKFECKNSRYYSPYSGDNEPLFEGDVVEVFLRTGDDPKKYYEIEVAPNGAVFFADIFNDDGDINVTFSQKKVSAAVRKTADGYEADIKIPFDSVNITGETRLVYFNAYRIETEGGIMEKNLLALNPTGERKFHHPEKFIPFELK